MTSHIPLIAFLIGFSGSIFANQATITETNESIRQHSKNLEIQDDKQPSIFSVPLYLQLVDNYVFSRVMAQSQLQVTPSTNLTVNNILVTSQYAGAVNCNDPYNTYTIGATTDPTFTVQGGHTYSTTDASMQALTTAGDANYVNFPTRMQFRNGTTNVGTSVCITEGGDCTSSINCGWTITKTWTP